jgi:signal transduction histidine kinase
MPTSLLNNIIHSVFLKLLLIIFITGLCINAAVGFFFMYLYMDADQPTPFRKNVAQYVSYLIRDLGSPPDQQAARELCRTLSMDIRYEGPAARWSTSETLPPVQEMRLRNFYENPHLQLGRYQGKTFMVVQTDQGQFTFDLVRSYRQQSHMTAKVAALIAVVTGLLAGAYFSIRRILRPIMWLHQGVQEVGRGNLGHRLRVTKSDELGTLAEAFNSMTGRIQAMLHAREQLLLDVSHELRSPLTRIKVALEFLPATDARKSISEDLSAMEGMLSEILETQRLRSEHGGLHLQPTDLAELIKEALDLFKNQPPGIILDEACPGVRLQLDRQRVATVLKNIFENAVKYSAGAAAPIRVCLQKTASQVTIRIADQGAGIPPEDLPYVFEPFYRVDKSRTRHTGGFGLGLSLCRTIMDAHQGKIEIESMPGSGTTISLVFPLLPATI